MRLHPILFLGLLLFHGKALGHSTGESYIRLGVSPFQVKAVVEFHAGDLADHLGIRLPENLPAPEVAAAVAPVFQFITDHLGLASGEEIVLLEPAGVEVQDTEAGRFVLFFLQGPVPAPPESLLVEADFFFADRPSHRCLVLLESNYRAARPPAENPGFAPAHGVAILSPERPRVVLDLANPPALGGALPFIREGVHHIWIGIDHILFLLTLLLPAVLRREGGAWVPVGRFSTALLRVVKIVTLFTVAHSVTLVLAALDVVRLPSRLVESAIALSILVVALNNLRPFAREGGAGLILAFGLFHGLGFATVLGALPFRMSEVAPVMLCFNLGVELGQLAVVAAVFPLLFLLRRSALYPAAVLRGGSVLSALAATFWFVQRAFAL